MKKRIFSVLGLRTKFEEVRWGETGFGPLVKIHIEGPEKP